MVVVDVVVVVVVVVPFGSVGRPCESVEAGWVVLVVCVSLLGVPGLVGSVGMGLTLLRLMAGQPLGRAAASPLSTGLAGTIG